MKSVPLAEIAKTIDYGVTASANALPVGPRFLRITDIQDDSVDWANVPFCVTTKRAATNAALEKGDIVFARTGATTGKSFLIRDCPDGAVFASYLIRVRPSDRVDPVYLSHFFQSKGYWAQVNSKASGAAQPGVNASKLSELEIPLPPLLEQRRIAGILDQADALRRLRRQSLSRLSDLPPAVLNFAQSELPAAPLVNARSKLPEAPRGARWALLTDVARLATGHTPDRKTAEYWNGDIPWISLTDIRAIDGLETSTTLQNVTAAGIKNSSAVVLPKGTVCLARTASVGFVTMMGREMATSQDFVNWVCSPDLDPTYLLYALVASRAELRSLAPGSTHKTIYFPTVESFRILLPNIDVQRQCGNVIKQYWAQRKRMEVDLTKLESLFASLQHRAFRGEL